MVKRASWGDASTKAISTLLILFLTGDLDNPARDKVGLEKFQSLGVPTKQTLLKDAKHGCWMQCPGSISAWPQ